MGQRPLLHEHCADESKIDPQIGHPYVSSERQMVRSHSCFLSSIRSAGNTTMP